MGTNLETEAIVISIYGGTSWTQITDKFLIGASSTYTVSSTGGSTTKTIATANLPSHNHTVTATGSISGGAYTFTGSAVTSGNQSANHTHSVTAAGTVAVKTNPTFTGSSATSGTQSANHTHVIYNGLSSATSTSAPWKAINGSTVGTGQLYGVDGYSYKGNSTAANSANHTHTVTAKGSISGGAYTFTGSAVTSGNNNANHTHSVTAAGTVAVKTNPTFTGSSANTSSVGSATPTAISILNPYYAVYIWVRTA